MKIIILLALFLFFAWGIYAVRNEPRRIKLYMGLSILALILIILGMGYIVQGMY